MRLPKKFKSLEDECREEVFKTLRRVLRKEKPILFAYIHGSFLESDGFNDIDVAAYVDERRFRDDYSLFHYELRLATNLDRALNGFPVDVRLLNRMPPSFRYGVVHQGLLLFSRNEVRRIDFECRTRKLFWDFIPHIEFFYRKKVLEE